MTAVADSPRRIDPASASSFQSVDIGERIAVRLGRYTSATALWSLLHELPVPTVGRLVVVLHPSRELAGSELEAMLDRATAEASHLVLVPQDPSALQGQRPCPVLVENDPQRAVVGVMQTLKAGDTLAVLWPEGPGADPSFLIALGARWRSTWDLAEEGEYHTL